LFACFLQIIGLNFKPSPLSFRLDIFFWRIDFLFRKKHFISDLIVEYKLAGISQAVLILLFFTLQSLHDELGHYLKLKLIEVPGDLNNALKTNKYAYSKLVLL
jgi:hypothetical protein